MKVAAKKTAKGYLVSDERCDLCEMPLLSMNGNLSCKVCPAIEKWAQKKSEACLSIEFVDAHDTFESAEKQSCASSSDMGKCPDKTDIASSQNAAKDLNNASESELGTCGICLEDYREGELKKALSCPSRPHSFHKDCIDKWLKLDASCPICKNSVEIFRPA